ncbi:MAG: branched-chain amino acid ABC transporter permease [Acetobacteraceae bacterium]
MLLQLVTSGLSQGSIYALVALGMTVLFRATTIVDFGHGELFMAGAFTAFVMVNVVGLSFPAAALASVLVMFVLGVLIERLLIRPMGDASHTAVAMMTVAFSFLFKGIARWFYGGDVLSMPPVFSYPPVALGSIVITVQDALITAVTLALVLAFLLLFRFSRMGWMGRAVAASPRGAVLVGIDLPRLSGGMWGLSAALGGVAGILVAPVSMIFPDMGEDVLLPAFAAMTLGGFGNFGGAILGGLLIGVLQQLAGGYVSSAAITIFPYLVIVGVLMLFPAGLFGSKETFRV